MKSSTVILKAISLLILLSLLLSACVAGPSTPANGDAAADVQEQPGTGTVLTDKPAGAGERPLQMAVYNSPADYEAATGNPITAFNEAPELAEMVSNGELPPVEERLPDEPVVVKPEETIGKYGGQLIIPIEGQSQEASFMTYFNMDPLTNLPPEPQGGETIPNVAKGWEISDDGQTIVFFLREGIRWSDGEPFTADDILFWWEDYVLNDELSPSKPTILTRGGELGEVSSLDEYTVQFSFREPYALFVTYLASWGGPRVDPVAMPKHYLSQFHPGYTDRADIQTAMEQEGFDSWVDFFEHMRNRANPDLPTLSPWVPDQWPPAAIQTYHRNPYYWKVDTEGNQLPYISEIRSTRLADDEAILLKTIAGDLDMVRLVYVGGVQNMSLLLESQEKVGYRFAYGTWMPAAFSNIMFNFSSSDPVKRELYNDVRFRRALSVAINREELIQLIWKGGVFPSQIAPLYGPPYHGESEMFKVYTEADPELANQLLDEIGLTERDSEGYRLGLDGETLLLVISATTAWPVETPEVMELVRGYWEQIGIRATVRPEAGELWGTRHNAGEHDISARGGHFGGGPVQPTLNSNTFALSGWQWAPEWALWLDTNGEQGSEPPDDVKRLRELHSMIIGEPDEARRVELTLEALQLHMNNLWSIGLVVDDPKVLQQIIAKNRVRNLPTWFAGEWYPNVPASWFINE